MEVDGNTRILNVDHDNLKYAHVLTNESKQRFYNSLGIDEGPTMRVSTSNVQDMLSDGVEKPLDSHVTLTLNASSISDLGFSYDLIRTTKAEYSISTDSAASSIINRNPFPWRVLYLDYNDPIWTMINSNSTIEFIFNNPSFDTFGPNLSINLVREIPKYIRLIPTNKTENNPYHGFSNLNTLQDLTGRAVRTITFTRGLDEEKQKTGLDDPPGFEIEYPGNPHDETRDNIAYKVKEDEPLFRPDNNFISGEQPPRTLDPISNLYQAVKLIEQRFILSEGLTVYDVFSRIGARAYYGLFSGVNNPIVVEQIKEGSEQHMGDAKTNVRWYKNTLYNNQFTQQQDPYWGRSRIVKIRTGSTPTKYDNEVYDNPSDRTYVGNSFAQVEADRVQLPVPTKQQVPIGGRPGIPSA